MKRKSRKFPTIEKAITYLEERGKLEYFGRAGQNYEYCVYKFTHKYGMVYHLSVYDDGTVVIRD